MIAGPVLPRRNKFLINEGNLTMQRQPDRSSHPVRQPQTLTSLMNQPRESPRQRERKLLFLLDDDDPLV
jgi:hypothetical protein